MYIYLFSSLLSVIVLVFVHPNTGERWLTSRTQWKKTKLLLKVQSTEELGVPQDKLLSFLQSLPTDDAAEARHVVDEAGHPHDELVKRYGLKTACASCAVQPV